MPHGRLALTRSRIRALRTGQLAQTFGIPQLTRFQTYLQRLVEAGVPPPGRGEQLDWRSMSARSGVPFHILSKAARRLRPILLDVRAAASRNGRCIEGALNTEPSSPTEISGLPSSQPIKRRSFNGRLRDELLNETLFRSLGHARAMLEDWRRDYNEHRPHSKLGWLTPQAFADALRGHAAGGAAQPGGSAPPALATPQKPQLRSTPDSRYGWMRNGGHVS